VLTHACRKDTFFGLRLSLGICPIISPEQMLHLRLPGQFRQAFTLP